MKKKHELIMLPIKSEGRSNIIKYSNTLIALQGFYSTLKNSDESCRPQHLYILSGDKIKTKDWFIDTVGSSRQATKLDEDYIGYRKIIATTDSTLMQTKCHLCYGTGFIRLDVSKSCKHCHGSGFEMNNHSFIPQIPKSFVKHYIAEYNKGKMITEVEVEYENKVPYSTSGKEFGAKEFAIANMGLKINQDNVINISVGEEKLYTKKDMLSFAKKYWEFMYDINQNLGGAFQDTAEETWIKENL